MRGYVLALILAVAGCGSDAKFATNYDPAFRRATNAVSVLGVYKDGRMSSEAWNDLGPRFASAFGGEACDVFYSDALLAKDPALAAAVDDEARANGVTDSLAGALAPASGAETIAFVTVLGHAGHEPKGDKVMSESTAAPSPVGGGGGGRSGGGGRRGGGGAPSGGGGPSTGDAPHDVLEVAMALYSVREHRTVGIVAMKYDGESNSEGYAAFVAKVRAELPGAKCVPWKCDVRIDPDSMKALSDAH